MKRLLKILAFATLTLMLVGCTTIKPEGKINGYTYSIGSEISNTELKNTSGYYIVENDDDSGSISYIILMGEMGYGDEIKIVDLTMDANNNLRITVATTHSRASEGPSVVTYPYCYLNISSKPNSVKVVDKEGREYKYISERVM